MKSELISLPRRVIHVDWGKDPTRRWMAEASLDHGELRADAPRPATDLRELLAKSVKEPPPALLIGFDFPIGLPWQHAQRATIASFKDFLLGRTAIDHEDFFRVTTAAGEISLGPI